MVGYRSCNSSWHSHLSLLCTSTQRGFRAGASLFLSLVLEGGNQSFCHLKIRSGPRFTPRQSGSCLRIRRLLDSSWLGSSFAWSCCSPQQAAVTRLISGIGKLGFRKARVGEGKQGQAKARVSQGKSQAFYPCMSSAAHLRTLHLGSQVPSEGQVGAVLFFFPALLHSSFTTNSRNQQSSLQPLQLPTFFWQPWAI